MVQVSNSVHLVVDIVVELDFAHMVVGMAVGMVVGMVVELEDFALDCIEDWVGQIVAGSCCCYLYQFEFPFGHH